MRKFIEEYIGSAELRLTFSELAINKHKFGDSIRECQAVVELCSKALLMSVNQVVPKKHDMKNELNAAVPLFSDNVKNNIDFMSELSKELRREREISMYGDDDSNKTQGQIYSEEDAKSFLIRTKRFYKISCLELGI